VSFFFKYRLVQSLSVTSSHVAVVMLLALMHPLFLQLTFAYNIDVLREVESF